MRRRTRVANPRLPWGGIPYPDGDANPEDELQVLVQYLDRQRFTAEDLSRVDDLLVNALRDKKRSSNRPQDVVNAKFTDKTLDDKAGSTIAFIRGIRMSTDAPLRDWVVNAEAVWRSVVATFPDLLNAEDKVCFCNLLIRYMLPFHASSPVQFTAVRFPDCGKSETGLLAAAPIQKGEWILHAGAVLSSTAAPEDIQRFSVMWRKFRGKNEALSYEALLVGVARFINHSCKPNAELIITRDDGPAMTLKSTRPIYRGEEIVIDYSDDYFGQEKRCLCSSCQRDAPPQLLPPTGAVPPLKKPKTEGDQKKRTLRGVRAGRGRVTAKEKRRVRSHIEREAQSSGMEATLPKTSQSDLQPV